MFIYYGLAAAAAAAPSASQEMVPNKCRNAFASILGIHRTRGISPCSRKTVWIALVPSTDYTQCDVMESHQVAA